MESREPSFQPPRNHFQNLAVRLICVIESRSVDEDDVEWSRCRNSDSYGGDVSCAGLQIVSNTIAGFRGGFDELRMN